MDYMVAQRERGAEGTEHWQGYIRFKAAKRMEAAKHYVGDTAHMENARGNEEQCRTYCSKEGQDGRIAGTELIEHGTYKPGEGRQGSRGDLLALANSITGGSDLTDILHKHPRELLKYPSGVQLGVALMMAEKAPAVRNIHTTVLWGTTGCGKSHRVRSAFPDAYIVHGGGRDPWGGYTNQVIIVFEEFHDGVLDLFKMNQYLDKWKLQIDCRYQNKWAYWTRVYILSNSDPGTWYSLDSRVAEREAFRRRIAEPMGRVYEVLGREQEIDLEWMVEAPATPVAAAPAAPPPPPAVQVPIAAAPAQQLRRAPSVDLAALMNSNN